jgi:iron complex outermembrane receptor protein
MVTRVSAFVHGLIAGGLMISSAHAQDRSYHFEIANQSLSQALRNFGHISGQEVIFTEDVVAGRAISLKGDYTAQSALDRMLSGTGLIAVRSASGVIMIRRRIANETANVYAPASLEKTSSSAPSMLSAAALSQSLQAEGPQASAGPDAPEESNSGGVTLEEVIVTGTKRAENIQNVPASVFVATAANMERANVRDFDDLVKIAPTLTITKTSQPANNSINIRGIGTYAYSIATESSVAVVIDDIPQAFQAAAFAALTDVRQVEVLRGPQNTLFGKAASAGVINITTEAPTDTFTAKAEAMATDDHEQRYSTTFSGPLSDTLKFRIAANYSDYRGNVEDISTGTYLNGQTDYTARGKLLWQPNENWNITLSPYYTRTPSTCCAGAQEFISPGVTYAKANISQAVIFNGITPGKDNRTARLDVSAQGNGKDYGSGLKIARELGGATLALISSYDRYQLYDRQDTDGSDFDFSTVAPTAPKGGSGNGGFFDISSVTDELRFTSADQEPFRYVAGLYFSHTSSQRDFVRGSNTLGTFNNLTSLPSTNSTQYSSYVTHAISTNYAVYGQGTYDITQKLSTTLGVRFNKEEIQYNFVDRFNNVSYGLPECSTTTPSVTISTCDDDTAVTGRASLQYRFTPDFMLFGGYSRGYKGQAYDLTSTLTTRTLLASGPQAGVPVADAVAAKQPISEETVNAYEIGFKSTLFNRVTWNVTVFDEKFSGFQAQSRDQITNQNVLNSIGKVTSKGVETELATAFGDFTLNGGGAYNKARIDNFPNANCFFLQTVAEGCVNNVQNLSGKPLFNAPKFNFAMNGQYDFGLPFASSDWRGFVSANYRWQSKVYFNLLQDPDSLQEAYGLFGMSLGAQTDRLKLTFFGNNLFDKSYALTRGRSAVFNLNRTSATPTDAVSWTPGRDSERYFGVRLSAYFQ